MNDKRLIEVAFPLEQTSLDSVHEKNVRHGHISTLHIWPARRPLAACRAALIATLLPDPGDKVKRDEILMRLGGTVSKSLKKKKLPSGKVEEIESRETQGGILHWGRESGPDLDWFRKEIRKAYGGRAPKVLDPFAGGGAIPLEAMRLGCEVTAVDINPVAWFILKCTLEYPQKLAGQTRGLPEFVLDEPAFMESYIKGRLPEYLRAKGVKESDIKKTVAKFTSATLDPAQAEFLSTITSDETFLEADLAWHVRAWGHRVLRDARRELSRFYPTYAEFCTVKPYGQVALARSDEDQLKLVPLNEVGEPQTELLNAGFDASYLGYDRNPRWIAKPTVAYLWARTVACKTCRATVPLLKTRWLCKKDNKRVVLTMNPNSDRTGVEFGIEHDVPQQGGNPAQRREHDKRVGAGTMSRSGVQCPCCETIMTMGDLQVEARFGKVHEVLTAVVVDGLEGKEYRLPQAAERVAVANAVFQVSGAMQALPFGELVEPISPNRPSPNTRGVSGLARYGVTTWQDLFAARQRLALASIVMATRACARELKESGYEAILREAIVAYLASSVSRFADRCSVITTWQTNAEKLGHTFARYALQLPWDYAESNPFADSSGGYLQAVEWIAQVAEHLLDASDGVPTPAVVHGSSVGAIEGRFDQIVTDPPYYDAIPYSDLMDFFHVWLRRVLSGLSDEFDEAFREPLGPKWSESQNDGELVDQPGRFGDDGDKSKRAYEDGMQTVFQQCHLALADTGRLVVVFANKNPAAWEALVSALIRAGFTVDSSWPIQTERAARQNALTSASLASSIWLVCRKREPTQRAGWDTAVLKEMEEIIRNRLREFWDSGIRGPDFVWSATGPALEAYSRYPAVKKATEASALMSVSEFLRHVRRMVVDFVVGRVLSGGEATTEPGSVSLDDITTYYLLHRNDFGLKDAPAGACILYATSCGLSERLLADQYEILSRGKSTNADDGEDESATDSDADESESSASGGHFKLRAWSQRKHRNLGAEPSNGKAVPLIDRVHKLMHLWKAGDENKVNDYLDKQGLRQSAIFVQLLQALIEKSRSEGQGEECSILEMLSNHLRKIGAIAQGALSLNS